jgi:hypothetical protein
MMAPPTLSEMIVGAQWASTRVVQGGSDVSRNYYQFAYVTNDFDRAMKEIGEIHGITDYMVMSEAVFATSATSNAICHFALANNNGVQYEIIQPLSGDDNVYRQILPESGYATLFHHIGQHFDTREQFDAALASAKAKWPVPIGFETMGGVYAYTDARKDTGHHIELFHFPPGSHLDAVPNN